MAETKIDAHLLKPSATPGEVLTNNAGVMSLSDPAVVLNRIAVSLAGDVITAGGFVIYSSL